MSIRRGDAWRGSLVVLTVLLTLGAGLCLFDQDADHHAGLALDFCLLMLGVVSIAIALVARPLPSGRTNTDLPIALTIAPVRAIDPPPKGARHF